MAAAICYAWLLGNREEEEMVVVPVVNIERGRMNKHKQAAWLFYHVGIDASALLFADEVLTPCNVPLCKRYRSSVNVRLA